MKEKVCSLTGEQIWEEVRKKYTELALERIDPDSLLLGRRLTEYIGYPPEWLEGLPEPAVRLFSGTGNPLALVSLREGMTVVDIGCGPGMDCLLAARMVAPSGKAIGIDMTEAMLERAWKNKEASGLGNVVFYQGQAEDIPLEDGVADVVISNGVINLCPCKETVMKEAYRLLKPGGILAVSDVFLKEPLDQQLQDDPEAWTS